LQPAQDTLKQALSAHQAGRLDEAAQLYGDVIETNPRNADAWHLMGCLDHARGRLDDAEHKIKRALDIDPAFPEALNNLGNVYKDQGDILGALAAYERALKHIPDFAEAWSNIGDARRLMGDLPAAEKACRRAVTLKPGFASGYNNLGAVLLDRGETENAATAFDMAARLEPAFLDAHINLSEAFRRLGKLNEAQAAAESAIANAPNNAAAHNALGNVQLARGEIDRAIDVFAHAVKLDPESADAANNMGAALTRAGQPQEALAWFNRALEMSLDDAGILANRGGALQAAGKVKAALETLERAVMIDPTHVDARWNRGIARLLSGDLVGGFADYEIRWKLPEFKRRHTKIPAWKGEDISGKRLLVHSEQGYGDTIHMIRFARHLAEQNIQVVVETHPPLKRLLETAPGVEQVITRGEKIPGDIQLQVPIMSLPHLLRITARRIPKDTPYLRASARPAESFGLDGKSFKVGIAWAGRPTHKNDRNRSLSLDAFAPLLDIAGIDVYGLQVDGRAADIDKLGWGNKITDLSPHIEDFADTAAILAHLNLVISVDTALVHLAGAMGRPAWVLLPFAPDWRWGTKRTDCPWYPGLTLYRQPAIGDWTTVIEKMAEDLAQLNRKFSRN